MHSSDSLKQAWREEYKQKGIPSSFRKEPSKPLVEFVEWLKRYPTLRFAAEMGCGQGRNSFYLASQGFTVTSIDLVDENVATINQIAKLNHLPIQAIASDVSQPWPVKSQAFDIVIDIFCYKHIVDKDKQTRYRQELRRTLKPEGFYFISLASDQDGFYGPLLEASSKPQHKQIIDPYSHIRSFLYSPEDLTNEFSDSFKIISISEQNSVSPMHGKEYSRCVINAIFQKRK
jgi:2-polyprenyl-3-methyl-5-hydroxy-6-metoxy-1,4-benzoquinol methylase